MFNRKEWLKEYKKRNKDKLKQQARELYWKNREIIRLRQNAYAKAHKNSNKQKIKALRLNWALTPDQFQYLIDLRQNKCDICKKVKKLMIDHDHENKRVRGLLCKNCNFILGHGKDDTTILWNAIKYLQSQSSLFDVLKMPVVIDSTAD